MGLEIRTKESLLEEILELELQIDKRLIEDQHLKDLKRHYTTACIKAGDHDYG